MARSQTSTRAPRALPKGIYKLSDGRYMAKVQIGVNADTKQPIFARPKSPSLDTVIERRDEIVRKLKDGEKAGGKVLKGITTAAWAREYLDTVVRPKATATTTDNYRWVIENLICAAPEGVAPIGPIVFRELSTRRINDYKRNLLEAGVGVPSINYMLSRLRAMFNAAMLIEEMHVNVNRALAVAKEHEEHKTPWVGSPSETRRLIEAAGDDYRASIIQVATDAGLRRSEIAGLQWGDIDWETHSITLRRHVVASGKDEARLTRILPGTKESEGRVEGPLFLSDRSMAMLRATRDRLAFLGKSWDVGAKTNALYVKSPTARTGTPYVIPANPVADSAWVWPSIRAAKATRARSSSDGAVYEPTSLGNWFSALVERAALEPQDGATKTLHDLRHDCATFLINKGVPHTVVAHVMRHADPSITLKVYSHLYPSQAKDGQAMFNRIWEEAWADEEAQAQAV